MAKIVGKRRWHIFERITEGYRRTRAISMGVMAGLGAIDGMVLGFSLRNRNIPVVLCVSACLASLPVVLLIWKWIDRKLQQQQRVRQETREGASAKEIVAAALANFPKPFHVLHNISLQHGSLEYIVVGPTGVFVVETRDWRGIVTADGKGELLLNGASANRPEVKQFMALVQDTKEAIALLVPRLDVYFQGVFVFTAAQVEAGCGTTGKVHCLRDDQLYRYIVDKRFGTPLSQNEVAQIAQAFLALARQDRTSSTQAATPLAGGWHASSQPTYKAPRTAPSGIA